MSGVAPSAVRASAIFSAVTSMRFNAWRGRVRSIPRREGESGRRIRWIIN